MDIHKQVQALAVPVLVAALQACSSSQFGSTAAKNASPNSNPNSANTAVAAPAATDIGAGTGTGSDPSADAAANGGGTNATSQDVSAPIVGLTTQQTTCLKKAALYNIVMVFDVSGSQAQTDPTKLRVAGAKDFLTKLSAFADATPAVKLNVSITGFATQASFGTHGWEALGKTTLTDLNGDIDTITAATADGTYYLTALGAADQLLVKQNASPTETKTRNFVIFMTDGEPNGPGKLADINAATVALTTKRGAAMIMLGTGTGVSAKGEVILKGMALPNPGIVNPKHIGQYHRVATPDQMAKIGDILTADVAGCETTTTMPASGT